MGEARARLGFAFGLALLINGGVIVAMVLLQRAPAALHERIFETTMVTLTREREAAQRKVEPPRTRAAAHEAQPRRPETTAAVPPPPAIPLAPAPPKASPWTVPAPSARTLEDRPSLWRSVRARERCAGGEFWKLSTEDQDACRKGWARYKPDPADGPAGFGRREALKDPDGDWGRAVAAAEDRRKPMGQAPVHPCRDGPSTNFDRPCH